MPVFVPAVASSLAPPRISRAAFSHRLSHQAQQCMKVAGASRRSAAPGSQFVGIAEYGDNSSLATYASAIGKQLTSAHSPDRGLHASRFVPTTYSSMTELEYAFL